MTDRPSHGCELCDEVRSAATWATAPQRAGADGGANFSRLIRRSAVVDVIAGLGAIIPGYVLIIPRTHVLSLGELDDWERDLVLSRAFELAAQIQSATTHRVVIVEHGSSGLPSGNGGACITHSHVHLFPIPDDADLSSFLPPGSRRIDGTGELARAARDAKSYYFVTVRGGNGWLLLDPPVQGQYARRVWAGLLGRDSEWDWAVYPHLDNCLDTVTLLRRDRLSESVGGSADGSRLRETVDAYNEYAQDYSERTRSFDDTGKLEEEMIRLLGQTSGVVLDAGAGAGRDAAFMAGQGREVIAVDASEKLLEHVPKVKGLTTRVGDIRTLPFGDDSIGAIWCSAVLVHLNGQESSAALKEFHRVLVPGGLVQISVKEGAGHSSERMSAGSSFYRHFYFYELSTLAEMAINAGFVIIDTWTDDREGSIDAVHPWRKLLLRKE